MSLWTESNPEIDKLKRINQALDLQVGNFGQQCASLKAQLAELTSTHKEALGKLSEKEAALLVAQDLARKKTDVSSLNLPELRRVLMPNWGTAGTQDCTSTKGKCSASYRTAGEEPRDREG